MKKKKTQPKKVSSLKPSAVLLSIAIHAVLFLLAGMLVVFTVVKKQEKKFVPPVAVERPKMKLKKPKVKLKKSSKPKSTTRIVTKAKTAAMPDMALPEMAGMGTGLGDGDGVGDGFDMMLDLGEITLLGGGQTIGNDFEGTFYDLKRDRSGRNIPMAPTTVHSIFHDFLEKGWDKSVLSRYYQSPKKIYTTTFMVPPTRANLAPEVFNEETEGWGWGIHFTGELVHQEDIRFRFWGNGLHLMAVRVDGEIVLLSYWQKDDLTRGLSTTYGSLWQSSAAEDRKYPMGLFKCHVGDWIELKADEPKKMEVLYGISGGGIFNAMLCVEVEGVEYPRNPYMGGPRLPIFKTEPVSRDLRDVIGASLYPGFASMTNGPVFCDFGTQSAKETTPDEVSEEPGETDEALPEPIRETMREWTMVDGKKFEAEYVVSMGEKLWMKTPDGRKVKIPVSMMSSNDLYEIELLNPPQFSIDLAKQSNQRLEIPNRTEVDKNRPIRRHDYVFTAKVKQSGMNPYNHPLTIEFFAIGDEVDGDNFVLFDRQKSTFTPSRENKLSHEFSGKTVDVMTWAMQAGRPMHGTKYGGFLITITNERGEMIQHKATSNFLLENIENLKKIPVGRHFDKMCNRVAPPRPTKEDVYVNSY